MKTTSKVLFALVPVLICLAPSAFALIEDPPKSVPETLSPLWLPVVVAGMFAVHFFRGKKH